MFSWTERMKEFVRRHNEMEYSIQIEFKTKLLRLIKEMK